MENITFIRSASFQKGADIFKMTAQPYTAGVYVMVENSRIPGPVQMGFTHEGYKLWSDEVVKSFRRERYKSVVRGSKYNKFLSPKELKKI